MPYAPRATFDNPYGPQIQFRTEDILPPAAYYVSMDDTLLAQMATDLVGALVTMVVRWLAPEGGVRLEQYQITSTGGGLGTYQIIVPPTEGYLLGVTLVAQNVPIGRLVAEVLLVRGPVTGAHLIEQVLMWGQLNQWRPLTYPPPDLTEPFVQAPALITITATVPAGVDWKITTPVNFRWRVLSALARLTTSAAAGNRIANLQSIDAGGFQNWFVTAAAQQAPSTAVLYSWAPAIPYSSIGGEANAPLPTEAYLTPGDSVGTSTVGIQAGDQWDFINIRVQQWIGA